MAIQEPAETQENFLAEAVVPDKLDKAETVVENFIEAMADLITTKQAQAEMAVVLICTAVTQQV
jgi:hypothetical protein